MTKKQRKMLKRIVITAVLYIALTIADYLNVYKIFNNKFIELFLYVIPYIIISYDIIRKAFKNMKNGQVFDENFLMVVATVAAFCVQEFSEAVAVMLLYQVGELFQGYAVGKSRQSISSMMELCPEYANIEEDGKLVQVDPEDVEPGMIITVKPNERVPLDGIVVEGNSLIDTSALTGESVPRRVREGSEIVSGCINGKGILKIEVTKVFEDSTVAKILELVENASNKKAKVENFITRFARIYTPTVTISAAILAIIPPLILGTNFVPWIQRACIFLVVSCPCALVISVPLGFFGGIGAASKIGVLVKGSNYLEAFSKVETIVFDKTGTLTKGEFKVTNIIPENGTKEELLEIAALGEGYSNHPIAASIRNAYKKTLCMDRVTETEELSGLGIKTKIDGKVVYLGNEKLMQHLNIPYKKDASVGTVVYISRENVFMGAIIISDTIKDGAVKAIDEIKRCGVKNCIMLTGDRKEAAKAIADHLHLNSFHAELMPQDKVMITEQLLEKQNDKEKLAFVGDGINDAPVLMRSDIGIAMGSMGSDAAIDASDIVIMDDDIDKIPKTIRLARKTIRIVTQNIVFCLTVKALVLILGVFGAANMWMAIAGDVGVSIIAIINSMRTLNVKK